MQRSKTGVPMRQHWRGKVSGLETLGGWERPERGIESSLDRGKEDRERWDPKERSVRTDGKEGGVTKKTREVGRM